MQPHFEEEIAFIIFYCNNCQGTSSSSSSSVNDEILLLLKLKYEAVAIKISYGTPRVDI